MCPFFCFLSLGENLRGKKVDLIHSQWIHSGGTIGMYGAWLIGVPFSFTGHAADIFRDRAALEDKIKRAEFIICISEFHRKFYLENGADPDKLIITYCGINTKHFTPKSTASTSGNRYKVIASGRLVDKKGFDYLLDACKLLEERVDFECAIAGSGELYEHLTKRIVDLDLKGRVSITGEPLLQEDIPRFMHGGDCYCLPCVWAKDNDVDGLPQMLMELWPVEFR